MYYISTR